MDTGKSLNRMIDKKYEQEANCWMGSTSSITLRHNRESESSDKFLDIKATASDGKKYLSQPQKYPIRREAVMITRTTAAAAMITITPVPVMVVTAMMVMTMMVMT